MSASHPTFILVPGLWHTTTHMKPLIDVLSKQQYEAKSIQLASVGIKSPRPTWDDEVQSIYSAVSQELQRGKDACLVLHSYAGMPGAEVINRLIADGATDTSHRGRRGKLVRAIFIAAYTFPAGFILDARDFIGGDNVGLSIDHDGICHQANPHQAFFNDLPSREIAQPWVDALEDAYYLGRDPVITSEDWRKVPVTALLCKRDNAVPPARQEIIWKGVESERIDTGHDPYISQPEKVAEILIRLVNTS